MHSKSAKVALGLSVALSMLLTPRDVSGAVPDSSLVSDAYVYLLGRALVVKQELVDLGEPGISYNVIKYNPLGSADFVNPNLDVAYLEAWIAVDEASSVILEVPEVRGRYYTAQILDEWGEVIANINERTFPAQPHGRFALVTPNSSVATPEAHARIALNSRKAKLLGRVELKDDPEGALALRQQFRLTVKGDPQIRPAVSIPPIDPRTLVGVELFDVAESLLQSAHDIGPAAAALQAKVRHVAAAAKHSEHRARLDEMIRKTIVPEFLQYAVTKPGIFSNNWLGTIGTGNYGSDYKRRTSANLVGIWANNIDEVIYFVGTRDADGKPLNGSHRYVLEFPASARPEKVVDSYWSLILVDVPGYRVVPNRLNRYNFNNYSKLQSEKDGSLRILLASQPGHEIPESNWLPAPEGKDFSLSFRCYVPKDIVKRGEWFPPAVKRLGGN